VVQLPKVNPAAGFARKDDDDLTFKPVGEQIMDHVNDKNYARIALYLTSCAAYVPEPDDTMVYKVVFDIYKKIDRYSEALRIAIRLNDSQMAQEVLDACKDELHKKQLCFMVARNGALNLTTEDESLTELLGNTQLSEHFLSLARDLDVFEAKKPEDIYKTHLTETRGGQIESARKNLADMFVNGFVNAGFGHDSLVTGDTKELSKWIYKCGAKESAHGKMSAAASIGMILMWDVDMGLNQIVRLQDLEDDHILAGASLASGIVSANVRNECDPVLALLTEPLEDKQMASCRRIGAALGLGLAYAGTQKEEILDLLTPIIVDPDIEVDLFSMASLSLGYIFVGTGKADIAENIIQGLMDRYDQAKEEDQKVVKDPMSRFACLGLGLLFLGLQEAADVTMAALMAVPGQIGQYAQFTVEVCAYAGSGNVMKIQKLLGVCAEHLEDNNAHQVGTFELKNLFPESQAAHAGCLSGARSNFDMVSQAVAALGIALISMGEEVGAQMSSRSFEHMLQYGEVRLYPCRAWVLRIAPNAASLSRLCSKSRK
jgi:26S proteasome regulatory subunit N1